MTYQDVFNAIAEEHNIVDVDDFDRLVEVLDKYDIKPQPTNAD